MPAAPSPGVPLEFYYDYGSPFSYLADAQLDALCRRTGATAVYRPMLLGGVFQATGNRSPALEPVEAKRRYGALTLQRWVRRVGVPFRMNPHFPIHTLLLMRAAVVAQREGVFERFHPAVFRAFWAEGRNLGDGEVLRETLEHASLDGARLIEGAAEPEVKSALRAQTEEAVARGVFGAPTFFVADEMFFGNDHLVFVEETLRATSGGPPGTEAPPWRA